MRIPQCNHCNERFLWKEVVWSILLAYKPIRCRVCGKTSRITFASRYVLAFIIFIPLLIFGWGISPVLHLSVFHTILIILLWCLALSMVLPFIAKYEVEKKT